MDENTYALLEVPPFPMKDAINSLRLADEKILYLPDGKPLNIKILTDAGIHKKVRITVDQEEWDIVYFNYTNKKSVIYPLSDSWLLELPVMDQISPPLLLKAAPEFKGTPLVIYTMGKVFQSLYPAVLQLGPFLEWNDGKLSILQEKTLKVTNKGIRYVIIPLKLKRAGAEAHSNLLLLDVSKNEVERFDPNGNEIDLYNSIRLDIVLLNTFSGFGIKYISPSSFCPQMRQEERTEGRGYCAAWSFWYLESKVLNPGLKKIGLPQPKSLTEYIQAYSRRLHQELEKYLKEKGEWNPIPMTSEDVVAQWASFPIWDGTSLATIRRTTGGFEIQHDDEMLVVQHLPLKNLSYLEF